MKKKSESKPKEKNQGVWPCCEMKTLVESAKVDEKFSSISWNEKLEKKVHFFLCDECYPILRESKKTDREGGLRVVTQNYLVQTLFLDAFRKLDKAIVDEILN